MKKKVVIFLCTRLADYLYQCIKYFSISYGYEAIVIRYRADNNANYDFGSNEYLKLFYKGEIEMDHRWLLGVDPVAIYCSSWNDREYLKVLKFANSDIPRICGLDNPWTGGLKQFMHCFLSPFTVRRYFNKIWVAGPQQFAYALRLGFATGNIMQGVYSADDSKFRLLDTRSRAVEQRQIIYSGRLVEYKRSLLLAEIFDELLKEYKILRNWNLVFAGRGPLANQIASLNNPNIRILDFVPPDELPALYNDSDLFCLPSKGEHWGVVVHEAILCGLPLILSDSVGAGVSLLINGYNGFSFKTDDRAAFKVCLLKAMSLNSEELRSFSQNSLVMSRRFSRLMWAATLQSVIEVEDGIDV